MFFSEILSIIGLSQKRSHFISDRKREFNQLTTEYEKLLRQTYDMLSSNKVLFDIKIKHLPIDTSVIENTLDTQINDAVKALSQVEKQRDIIFSNQANKFSLKKWDELISRRQIQKSNAEYLLENAKQLQVKLYNLTQ